MKSFYKNGLLGGYLFTIIFLFCSNLVLEAKEVRSNSSSLSRDNAPAKVVSGKVAKTKKDKRSNKISPLPVDQFNNFIAHGKVSYNLVFPQIEEGKLKSVIFANTMRGLKKGKIFFESMTIRFYQDDEEDMVIRMPAAVFDTKTQILACNYKTVIESKSGLLIKGDGMAYDTKRNYGRLVGSTSMSIDTKEQKKSGGI